MSGSMLETWCKTDAKKIEVATGEIEHENLSASIKDAGMAEKSSVCSLLVSLSFHFYQIHAI